MTRIRDDRDLERLLRSTLQTAARSVDDGPQWPRAEELPTRHGRRRWVAPLLTAAAVAAVATTVVVAGHGPARHGTPPASSPTAHGTATSAPTPTPNPVTEAVRKACQARLQVAWRAAVAAGTTQAGAISEFPLAVLPDGRVLVSRDFGSGRDVALLSASGSAEPVYSIPQPNLNTVAGATVEGHWAVLPVLRQPRDSNGVLPTVMRVVLLDLRTGSTRTIANVSDAQYTAATHVIDGATLLDGAVYYDVRRHYGNRIGTVHRYDIATGRDTAVTVAPIGSQGPRLLAGGVSWSDAGIDVPRRLPDPVAAADPEGAVTDGSSYAWLDRQQRVHWFGAGKSAAFSVPARGKAEIIAVAGPIVFYDDQRLPVRTFALDTRTGAVVALPSVQPYAVSANGVVALYAFAGAFKQSPTEVVRLDTSGLPELHC